MGRDINWFIHEGLLVKTPFIHKLVQKFIGKAKSNLVMLSILLGLQNNLPAREALHIPKDFDSSEWAVVCAYYAMYMAALATLARINYKSKSHSATVLALDTFFVKKQLLEEKYLQMIEKAHLEEDYVDCLDLARNRREIAQYSVSKETTRKIAEEIKEDAYRFVEKMERLSI